MPYDDVILMLLKKSIKHVSYAGHYFFESLFSYNFYQIFDGVRWLSVKQNC